MRMITKARAGVAVLAALIGSLGVAGSAQAVPSPAPATGVHLVIAASPADLQSQGIMLENQEETVGISHGSIVCVSNVAIQRYALNLYVSTELAFTGNRQYELRARATSVGPWERYSVCRDENTRMTNIVAQANGDLVAEENAYTGSIAGMLRARTAVNSAGPWELFYTDQDPISGHCTQIRSYANGLFVAAEEKYSNNDNEMLRARTPASGLGNWEDFCWA